MADRRRERSAWNNNNRAETTVPIEQKEPVAEARESPKPDAETKIDFTVAGASASFMTSSDDLNKAESAQPKTKGIPTEK